MFKTSKIFTFGLLIKLILTLKPNDFCNLNEKETCQIKYPFMCGKNKCTTDEVTCIEFLKMKLRFDIDIIRNEISKYSILNIIQPINSKLNRLQESKYFELFNKSILMCPLAQYSLKASKDLCKTGLVCYEKQNIPMRSGNINYTKKTACKCTGNLSYQCGLYLCTIHKRACDEFSKMNLNQKNSTIRSVPNCKN